MIFTVTEQWIIGEVVGLTRIQDNLQKFSVQILLPLTKTVSMSTKLQKTT
jgi:hypothetical protein